MSGSYQVFARKYRPKTFADVKGQDHVMQTLKNAIEQERLAHAYLFVGPRGTGKTTTARIFAKALNCPGGPKVDFDPEDPVCVEIAEGNSLDVLEIDGASNNGVDQVRDLRDTVMFAPAAGKFKIYYIDEVHMLSTAAFNALLKTLEEPPEHVKFIFATTDPQKILPTIISRCQRFDLRRIPTQIIADQLKFIAQNESLELSDSAAYAIARGADGGMRDSQSMLDQMVAFCGNKIEEKEVLDIFGFNSEEAIADIAACIVDGNTSKSLELVHHQAESGKDLGCLIGDLITYFRNVLIRKVDPNAADKETSPEMQQRISASAEGVETGRLLSMIDLLAETEGKMKWAANKKLHVEIAMIKAIQSLKATSLDDVIALVSEAATGAPSSPVANVSPPQTKAAAPAEPVPQPTVVEQLAQPTVAPTPAPVDPVPAEVSVPTAPAPEARPPAPEPTPQSGFEAIVPTSPSGETGPEFWETTKRKLIEKRPLLSMWLEGTHYLERDGNHVLIGFAPDQRMYRESLLRHEAEINATLSEVLGDNILVKMEIRDDLQPLYIDETEDLIPVAQPSGNAAPPPQQPAKEEAPPELEPLEPAEMPKDFYNDPLINEAVQMFDAKIKK